MLIHAGSYQTVAASRRQNISQFVVAQRRLESHFRVFSLLTSNKVQGNW